MSTISAVSGSGSTAWSATTATSSNRSTRDAARFDRMFAKVDGNGDGSVDQTELQTLLDKMAKRGGTSSTSAADVLKKMDANGDGTLSKDELAQGMKDLRPQAGSTAQMARQHGHGGPPPAGRRGNDGDDDDAASAGSSASSGTGSTAATDPADTNGDGTVSAQERSAAMLKALRDLVSAAYSVAAAVADQAKGATSTSAAAGSSISFTA